MKNRKPKIVVAPEGCESNLTPSKEYQVTEFFSCTEKNGWRFEIMDDDGDFIGCLERNCDFLHGGSWIVKQYEDE